MQDLRIFGGIRPQDLLGAYSAPKLEGAMAYGGQWPNLHLGGT